MALHDGGGWFSASALLESVGDSISRTLLPIVAVSVLGASTAAVGLLNSLGLVAFLLLSLPVGLLADRRGAPVGFMTAEYWRSWGPGVVRLSATGPGAESCG